MRSKISGATPDSGEVKQGAKRAAGVAQENPLGLAIGATAFGFLVGMLVPSTKIEDERIGPMADEIKEKARRPAGRQWSAARRWPSRPPRARRDRQGGGPGARSGAARPARRRRSARRPEPRPRLR